MKILIGADIVPTKSNIELFRTGDAATLVGDELLEFLGSADYRIFNLEVPLTDQETLISKNGPNLIAPAGTVAGIKAIGADFVTLANNHILDQGEQGLRSTVKALEQAGITYAGVGNTPAEAARPYTVQLGETRVGIYCCAEHEFSIVEEDRAGANPFDPLESPDHVAALKKQCDYVVVLYHGGKEHYRYPSPNLQRVCRKLVEKGADLVICQHTHCIGCEEKYLDGTIVYGQGNFLFDHSQSIYWQTSLLVQIGEDFSVSYIPLQKRGNTVRLAEQNEAQQILKEFVIRSRQIQNPGFVAKSYADFAHSMRHVYFAAFSGKESILFRVANKLLGNRLRRRRYRKRYTRQQCLAIRNVIECEAHREVVLTHLTGITKGR